MSRHGSPAGPALGGFSKTQLAVEFVHRYRASSPAVMQQAVLGDAERAEQCASDADGVARAAAVRTLAEGWHGLRHTRPLLVDRATSDPDGAVRIAALTAIAIGWRDDPKTLRLLHHHAAADPDTAVRDCAASAIATAWQAV